MPADLFEIITNGNGAALRKALAAVVENFHKAGADEVYRKDKEFGGLAVKHGSWGGW